MEANRFLPVEPRSIAFCVLPRGEIGYEVHTIAAWHELYRERDNINEPAEMGACLVTDTRVMISLDKGLCWLMRSHILGLLSHFV